MWLNMLDFILFCVLHLSGNQKLVNLLKKLEIYHAVWIQKDL